MKTWDTAGCGLTSDVKTPLASQDAVAERLRRYAEDVALAGTVQVGGSFAPDPPADRLIRTRPEAFILGILFTQGIPAERAWSGPYELSRRLGHLDLVRLAAEESAVAEAFARPPALHRFVKTVPHWVSSAARRLIARYGGDARQIWTPGSHVLDVNARLLEFDGIGAKKAAMAVELLVRQMGVELEGMECGTVAYDVHVRRVFLRSGLIDRDTPAEVRRAASEACPVEPGSLDLATWLIGREWCRPHEPLCAECPLGSACPRLVTRGVAGVGERR
ncbi:MAG: hypothetical protein WBI63_01550 [Coriobacteriia bacterium]